MKADDVKALRAIRQHAADAAAQRLMQADAQRADAQRALVTHSASVGNEVQKAQGFGLSRTLALWYGAAASRLQDLEAMAAVHADQVVAAQHSLRAAMTEAKQVETLWEQVETQRRARMARHLQSHVDEMVIRRRLRHRQRPEG